MVVTPPPVIGLGTLGGFKLQVEDRADAGPEALFSSLSEALGKANKARAHMIPCLQRTYQITCRSLTSTVDRRG